jgi:hypothetical protein
MSRKRPMSLIGVNLFQKCPFSVCFQDENNQDKKYFKFEYFIADSHADFRDLFILCRTV